MKNLNELAQGGQRYWAFSFIKTSLVQLLNLFVACQMRQAQQNRPFKILIGIPVFFTVPEELFRLLFRRFADCSWDSLAGVAASGDGPLASVA